MLPYPPEPNDSDASAIPEPLRAPTLERNSSGLGVLLEDGATVGCAGAGLELENRIVSNLTLVFV